MVPVGTEMVLPFTRSWSDSLMVRTSVFKTNRRIPRGGNFSLPSQQQIRQQPSRAERRCDAETFVARREPDAVARGAWADQRQLVGRGGAVAGPGADCRKFSKVGQIFDGTPQHAIQNRLIHRAVIGVELPR